MDTFHPASTGRLVRRHPADVERVLIPCLPAGPSLFAARDGAREEMERGKRWSDSDAQQFTSSGRWFIIWERVDTNALYCSPPTALGAKTPTRWQFSEHDGHTEVAFECRSDRRAGHRS